MQTAAGKYYRKVELLHSAADLHTHSSCYIAVLSVLLLAPTVSGLTISPTVVMQHDDMSLHCPFSIRNCNCDNIIWYKDNTILQTNTPNHIQTASKSIVHIKRVTTRDSGYYRCEAQVNGRVVRNSQAKLMVQQPVVVNINPHKDRVQVGDSVTITCTAHNAFLTLWQFNGRQLDKHSLRSQHTIATEQHGNDAHSTLMITNIQREDKGTYTCRGLSEVASKASSTELIIEYAPSINITSSRQGVVTSGRQVSLQCHANAQPLAEIEWYYNGTFVTNRTSKLSFGNLQVEDSGVYECRATNRLGTAIASTHLRIKDRLTFYLEKSHQTVHLGHFLQVPVNVNHSHPHITWFKGGKRISFESDKHYKMDDKGSLFVLGAVKEDNATFKYRLHLSEIAVIQECVVTVLYPPSPVRNLTVLINKSTHGITAAILSWQKPLDNGNSQLASYRVTSRKTSSPHYTITTSVTIPAEQVTLEVTINETAVWMFSVIAENTKGYNSSTRSTQKFNLVVRVRSPRPPFSPPVSKYTTLTFRLLLVKTRCSDETSHVTSDAVRSRLVQIINSLSPEFRISDEALHVVDLDRYGGEGISLLANVLYDRGNAQHIATRLTDWVKSQSDSRVVTLSGIPLTVSYTCPTVVDMRDGVHSHQLCPITWDEGILDCSKSMTSRYVQLKKWLIILSAVLGAIFVTLLVVIIVVMIANRERGNKTQRRSTECVHGTQREQAKSDQLHRTRSHLQQSQTPNPQNNSKRDDTSNPPHTTPEPIYMNTQGSVSVTTDVTPNVT